MTDLLPNHLGGRWQAGTGAGSVLRDPVTGEALVRVDAEGLDLAAGFAHAREVGGAALRALTYAERAALLGRVAECLQAHRADYEAIATANSGTVRSDSAIDIDGGIYTLGQYARLGAGLGERRWLPDGEPARLAKALFESQHVQVPVRGLALCINAFNFPSWGLWEKAAPALLSGVPVVVKPASATAWLTQRMVRDVVDAGLLPEGALSVVCGRPEGLLDALQPLDLLSFTGSADTAAQLRAHRAVARDSVRVNIEADSVNAAWLLPGAAGDDAVLDLLVREVVREMTVKSGQKCTAIRRIFVPAEAYDRVAGAIAARLAKTTVGNPRHPDVRMGALVSRAQWQAVQDGLARLRSEAGLLHDGAGHALVDADPAVACCVGPTLLGLRDADAGRLVHDTEVFGPVATLLPFRDTAHALDQIRRGQGSLVVSVYGADPSEVAAAALALADTHGRVHAVTPDVATLHTGHGNVMPQSLHGGPGRAGGGEELGGLRALNFYHRRSALQASRAVLDALAPR
ncbi:3,4-dehydroadipyl-CoA semialdehyde dehydrogenase [Piscinibacter sakaiensis]|uniref:Benzaldehyde dehydrogenase n=1 Tax=Piscinibacter sakaiensis TaxID=1547922 RepID=A0A0K8P2X8_PISS1|nr:3,4-dehydroadipyl-CoA semialdehyde dehydrogenase [Piscinibacter sakaiensis]GAP36963.1 benzaldehyde dehydrogenase [Piscinibacter sakaiensis]